ncbi:hypothetical protein QTP88_018100 [Uroleucon formosanum]
MSTPTYLNYPPGLPHQEFHNLQSTDPMPLNTSANWSMDPRPAIMRFHVVNLRVLLLEQFDAVMQLGLGERGDRCREVRAVLRDNIPGNKSIYILIDSIQFGKE